MMLDCQVFDFQLIIKGMENVFSDVFCFYYYFVEKVVCVGDCQVKKVFICEILVYGKLCNVGNVL